MFLDHPKRPVKDRDNIPYQREPANFLAAKAVKPMLTFFGLKVSYETLAFFALFIASEVVGNSKLKENSIVQLFMKAVDSIKPFRSEDDRVKKVKDSIFK